MYIREDFTEEMTFTLDFQVGGRVEVKDVKCPFRLETDGRKAAWRMVVRLILRACESPGKNKDG